nr:ABC transporter substrate binding protein [uncultured Desulfobacter sp.]
MEIKVRNGALLLFFLSILLVPHLYAGSANAPKLNNGKKWRVAYYEGGPYSEYTDTMRTLVDGLIQLGWITADTPPDLRQETPKPYIDWLTKHGGPYLSFKPEDCYSADWDDQKRADFRKQLLEKLKHGDIDIVLAMGTWAGMDMANNQHSVPVMVLSTSDPIRAGIINSATDSGFDHVTARVDPNRYSRQLRMFHRIVGFDTLGIAFENTKEGRSYSAIDEAEQIAKERGFKLITCNVLNSMPDKIESDGVCLKCFQDLSKRADAVYVTALVCADTQTKEVADIFKKARIPSFSMLGPKWVKEGILMSISSDSGYKALSSYNADKFGQILNGTKPRSLNQILEDPLNIAINTTTAKAIGFPMPKSIMAIATEIYGE